MFGFVARDLVEVPRLELYEVHTAVFLPVLDRGSCCGSMLLACCNATGPKNHVP